jgi:hypothetical protein
MLINGFDDHFLEEIFVFSFWTQEKRSSVGLVHAWKVAFFTIPYKMASRCSFALILVKLA